MSDKPKYGLKEFSKIDPYDRSKVLSPKLDGAHSILRLKTGKLPRIFSHRISSRTGSPIEYTPKLRHITEPAHVDAVVRAETFAVNRAGEAVHPNTVAAMLNRTVENSLSLQDSLGLRTRTALIDVDSYKGKSTRSLSFEKKREILEEIAKEHKNFILPPLAKTPEQKIKLLREIKAGTHKLTQEGVIEHDLKDTKSPFTKAPIVDTHDIYVRKIFREDGKPGRAPMAGGFWYSWDPEGEIVGKVGTGFSHDLKYKMLKNPSRYIGRVAKVKAHDLSARKVLVKPSFTDWHVEKNISSDGWAKQSIIVPKTLAATRKDAEKLARPHADRIYTSRETGSSFRFRQRPPERFEPGTFRHWNHPSGVGILFGKLREGGFVKKAYKRGEAAAMEKLALLWHPGKDPKKFSQLAERLAFTRAKNMGVPVNSLKAKLSGAIFHRKNDAYYRPGSPGFIRLKHGPLTDTPGNRSVTLNHELDEAHFNGRIRQRVEKMLAHKHSKDVPLSVHFRSGIKAFKELVKPKSAYASHASPEVLLRESNRLFSEAMPGTKTTFLKGRDSTGELNSIRAAGLRYGDEYIPEGGKKWRAVVRRMQAQGLGGATKKKRVWLRKQDAMTKYIAHKKQLARLKKSSPKGTWED